MTCCILHNLCIEMGDHDPPEEIDADEQAPREVPVPAYNRAGNADDAKRRTIILNHFQ